MFCFYVNFSFLTCNYLKRKKHLSKKRKERKKEEEEIDSCDSVTLENTLILHNVIILIKSVFNKDQNHYYYNLFLVKCSYQLVKKQWK